MGKASLVVRATVRLEEKGTGVVLDWTPSGTNTEQPAPAIFPDMRRGATTLYGSAGWFLPSPATFWRGGRSRKKYPKIHEGYFDGLFHRPFTHYLVKAVAIARLIE